MWLNSPHSDRGKVKLWLARAHEKFKTFFLEYVADIHNSYTLEPDNDHVLLKSDVFSEAQNASLTCTPTLRGCTAECITGMSGPIPRALILIQSLSIPVSLGSRDRKRIHHVRPLSSSCCSIYNIHILCRCLCAVIIPKNILLFKNCVEYRVKRNTSRLANRLVIHIYSEVAC